MDLFRAAVKLASFAHVPTGPPPVLVPFPWAAERRPRGPYYVINPVADADDRGGYARRFAFDDQGVPYRASEGGERRFSALITARYALKQLALQATRADAAARAADWSRARSVLPALVASARSTGAWGDGPSSDTMTAETPSGMVQGVVISALLRITDGKPDPELTGLLERAFERMWAPIAAGGARSEIAGGPFLEEFPRRPPSHILNGCIYGLFGLYDLADTTANERVRHAAEAVERTLIGAITKYNAPLGWSHYALDVYGHRPLASLHYHAAHVALARVVGMRTGSESLLAAARCWERALDIRGRRLLVGAAKASQTFYMRVVRSLPLQEG